MSNLRYNINSYKSVLSMRKRSSLLVEGQMDKKMICRLLNSYISNLTITIDSADMISGDGLGKREIVEELAVENPNRLVGWVDREFREFCLDNFVDYNPNHKRSGTNIYWTRGHSIENYLFHVERFTTFLQMNHPEDSSQSMIQLITLAFDELLAWSLALSVALKKSNLLSRSRGIFNLDSWDILIFADESMNISINKIKIQEKLIDRGIPAVEAASAWGLIESIFPECLSKPFSIRRWMVHGHVAEEALWSGIGKVCLAKGMSEDVSNNIAVGFVDLKSRHGADWWVRAMKPDVQPSDFIDHITKICMQQS